MKYHFVLVHGLCHGAWCWYKLTALLKAAGHRVTALDMGGSGIDPQSIEEIATLDDYFQPLFDFMASLPREEEKVILVGHSYGGFGLALAMEKFPEKIFVAVFVTAMMPNTTSPMGLLLEESVERSRVEGFMDTKFWFDNGAEAPTSFVAGPEILSKRLYQLCQSEDIELAKMLVRPNRSFQDELNKELLLTEEKFGSVDRVFVMCEEDQVVKMEFQNWIVERSPPKEMKRIVGADHMPMMSTPKELCLCLVEIGEGYTNK